jgi:hypothetical protein
MLQRIAVGRHFLGSDRRKLLEAIENTSRASSVLLLVNINDF